MHNPTHNQSIVCICISYVYIGITWSVLGDGLGHPVDLTASVDVAKDILAEKDLDMYHSDIFDQY